MELKEKKELALKSAKIVTNIGVVVLVFCAIWILQWALFPNIFDQKPELVAIEETAEEATEYVPILEIDSVDVVDGIHIPTGLVVDTGVTEVMTTCGACHSLDLVTQNRATRKGWKDLIVWMQETQKLWDLGEKEDIILDYLAKNYAPENTGRRKNLENIEWYVLN